MKISNHHFISEYLPKVFVYHKKLLFVDEKQGLSIAGGFRVLGVPLSTMSDEMKALLRHTLQNILNNLDITIHLDFFWTTENDYSDFIDGFKKFRDADSSKIALHLMDEKVHRYNQAMEMNELRYRKLYVFVNFCPPTGEITANNPNVKSKKRKSIPSTEYKAACQKIDQVLSLVMGAFTGTGMTVEILDSNDIRLLYHKVYSPLRHIKRLPLPQVEEKMDLWPQVITSDVHRDGAFLHYDENYHAFVTMAAPPLETRLGFLIKLFELSFPDYDIKLTIKTTFTPEQIKKLQSSLSDKSSVVNSASQKGKIVNEETLTHQKELREEIEILASGAQQVFETQLMMHMWHTDKLELKQRINEAKATLSFCGQITAVLEDLASLEAMRSIAPGYTREPVLDRFHPIKTVNTADLIPCHTDFTGTTVPQLLFPTREGGLCKAHIFSESRPYHNVVIGETGGGKTFFMNSVFSALVAQGLASLTVISTKNEFGPLMSVYGGQTITFDPQHPFYINPCSISDEKPTQDERVGLRDTLETIFGEIDDEPKRKLRESRILRAAELAYQEHGSKTRLRHIRDHFMNGWENEDKYALRDLANTLSPYCSGGIYGEYFDSDTATELNLSANFKFFDFSRAQNDINLSAVMMMALTRAEARRLSTLPKSSKKVLALDECWKFVDTGTGSSFIENALRVYRAYNCAVFLTSQQATDFLNSKISHVIYGNCHNYFALRVLDPDAIRVVQEKLLLTNELAGRFISMPDPSESGYSCFIYVHRGGSRQIAGEATNHVSKEEALLYSTNADVSQLRDHLLQQASDPWDAISNLAKMSKEEIKAETQKLFSNS